jgi:acyl-CoA synthetase (AMP-forming)/AMP-acid ligase II
LFTDYLDRGVRHNPDGVCIVRADGSDALTHREFCVLSHRVAAGLKAHGLGDGSKVAVFGPNTPLAFACVVGIVRSGAGWVALNPRAETRELRALLALLDCDYLIFDERFEDRARELLADAPGVRGSVAYGQDQLGTGFERWLGPPGVEVERLAFRPVEPVMYLGTGGTTGTPKAVVISARQFMTMCAAFEAHAHEPEPSVYLMATPMTHAAGCLAFPTIAHGGTIVVHDGVDPSEIFASIERHRVTRLFLPPTAIYALLAAPDVSRRDYSSLRHFIYAAAPMSADKLIEAMEVFGPVMTQTFGQAEAPMICTYFGPEEHARALSDPAKRRRLSSCGRAAMLVAAEIMDDQGQLLGPGERGEIVVRGDLVMQGYHGNPEATARAQRSGGWLGTGDVGYRDEDGFFYIVDRKRDMIISGGFNVFPSEVERVIWSHDAVLDCAVIGVPDDKWGEAVTAVVELKNGFRVAPEELISMCKRKLGSVQTPKAIHFRELPRSANGKVLKRVLRDEYWAGRERMV